MNKSISIKGVTLSGEESEVIELAKALGLPTYHSLTHGTMLVADMHDNHLENAVKKRLTQFKQYIGDEKFTEFYNLIRELESRNPYNLFRVLDKILDA